MGCYATPLDEGGRNTFENRCGNNSSTPMTWSPLLPAIA